MQEISQIGKKPGFLNANYGVYQGLEQDPTLDFWKPLTLLSEQSGKDKKKSLDTK